MHYDRNNEIINGMLKSTPHLKHIIFGLNSNIRPGEPVTNDRNGFETHSHFEPYMHKF